MLIGLRELVLIHSGKQKFDIEMWTPFYIEIRIYSLVGWYASWCTMIKDISTEGQGSCG